MAELPPQMPQPPIELAYETPPAYGSAPLLVRLAAIFALVTTGLDVIHALVAGGMRLMPMSA